MRKSFYLLMLCVLTLNYSFSQLTKQQVNERKNFVKELSRLIAPAQEKEANEFVDSKLSQLLTEGNAFSDERFQRMSNFTNQIIEKRHNAYPHAYNYILTVYSYTELKKSNEEFNLWHQAFEQLLENRNPKRVQDFLQSSGELFYQGIIYKDANYQWISSERNFEFIVDKTPYVQLSNTNIICRTINRGKNKNEVPYSDSIKIQNTNGTIDFTKRVIIGKGGTYTWEKVGLPTDETNAKIFNYNISLSSTNINFDTVELKTPYISEPVLGSLIDRAAKGSSSARTEGQSTYPLFTSFKADFEIKNLIPEVDYSGGFSLEGNEFIGIGNKVNKAKLTYYNKGEVFIVSHSDQVRIKDNIVRTPMARFALYFANNDSISHPGLNISYNVDAKTVTLVRGTSPITQAPFVDSYHKMNIYVDEIIADKNSNKLTLGFNRSTSEQQRIAKFESFNYYNEQLFQKIQGIAAINPLTALYNYAWKYDKFEMTEGMAATSLDRTLEQAKPILLELSAMGFISYDTDNGIVLVTSKTENFVKAKSGKIDFDNISFLSDLAPLRTDNANNNPELLEKINTRNKERAAITEYGTLDLTSLDLNINAIDIINISDYSKTAIFPENYQATIKQDRRIIFSGWINSGKWELQIEDGNYDYAENKFNIFSSSTAYFRAIPLKAADGDRLIPIESVITGLKGELIVNDVANRSGTKKGFDNYPVLTSKEKAKVYYDHRKLYYGAYDKERFYFELDPFTIDSLVTFDDKSIRFAGELTSAGIFPKIKDELKIMPDYSLGFSKKVPEKGYQFYGTGATYNNQILLSNNGLQGGGKIDFLTSSSTSKQLFTFLPDSAIGVASYINRAQEAGVEYPDVEGPDAFITFLPKKKTLRARSNNEPLLFFGQEAKFKGTSTLRETGMSGTGMIELPDASMISDNFNFKRWKALADTSSFQLKNKYKEEGDLTEDALSFKTENVRGDLDFKERKGLFVSNKGESVVEFPVNQYICKIDQFTWMMGENELVLEKNKGDESKANSDMDLVGPNFYSIHPKQDSLQFESSKAVFDLRDNTIYAYEAEFIEIADARIYPDSATIIIRKKARMEPFENAVIVANYITKYHTITNVKAQVTARRAYTATGDYEYGLPDAEKQYIHLNEIKLDTSYQTIAKGTIVMDENFTLSEQFGYYGDVLLKAANPYLTFKGATQLNHNCEKFERNWMAFETEINPENIQIPIAENINDLSGNKLSAGIQWRNSSFVDSVKLYPTFLSAVEAKTDPSIITASGFLQYNKDSKEFQIASKEKLINRNEPGNYISLHTETCSMNGDGVVSLGMDYGQFETAAVGIVNYDQDSDEVEMNITLAMRAPLNEKSFETIGDKISTEDGLKDGDFATNTLEQALVEWVDLKSADKIKSDYTLKKEFKTVPRSMRDAIVITGIKLGAHTIEGDPQKGLKTIEEQALVVNLFKKPVMKYVPFKLFAERRPAIGDRFGLQIDIPGSYMYFIDYDYRKEGVMSILSNDEEFNDEIEKLNPKNKKIRRFSYDITRKSSYMTQFLRVFY